MRPRPRPPHPDLIRRPNQPFGWLESALLTQGWLQRLEPDATAVLLLLALAADRHGASFYSRNRMAQGLGMTRDRVDAALEKLTAHARIAHRPWSPGHTDGVWQLLPLPPGTKREPPGGPLSLAEILQTLGYPKPTDIPHGARDPPPR